MNGWQGAYQHFFDRIPYDRVEFAIEVGSRDGLNALQIRDHYDAHVTVLECNPEAVAICESKLAGEPNIEFIPKAAWRENSTISFYPVVNGNMGASSLMRANTDYPYERYEQVEIEVESIRLDSVIDRCDLLCIDAQGAELGVLAGMGELLSDVRFIITEAQTRPMYHGASLLTSIGGLLSTDFKLVEGRRVNDWFGDYLFVNRSEL